MRASLMLLCIMLGSGCAPVNAPASDQPRDTRPNVVVVLLDDLGYSDFGFMGSEIKTPHVDGLAANGVTLSQFYVHPRCSPTRATLLTGRSPHEAGLGFLAVSADMASTPGPYQGHLAEQAQTLADQLGAAGYATFMSGKWHLGEARQYWPRAYGFDRYFGLLSGASSYYELLEDTPAKRRMALDDTPYVPGDDFYMTDAISSRAVEFVRDHLEQADNPFFLYLSYTAPHWPLHARADDIARYSDAYLAGPQSILDARRRALTARGLVDANTATGEALLDPAAGPEHMAVYAAMVTATDRGIGGLLRLLGEYEVLDDTLILVFSDNGASAVDVRARGLHRQDTRVGERGSYLSYGQTWATVSNAPLRGHKGSTFEGGVRSPLVAHWPAGMSRKAGFDTQTIAGVADVHATILDAAGLASDGDGSGESLLPYLSHSKRQTDKSLYWEHAGWRGVRRDDYKAVFDPQRRAWMLFNLAEDPIEQHDLATRRPDVLDELSADWTAWANQVGVDDEALAELIQQYQAYFRPQQ